MYASIPYEPEKIKWWKAISLFFSNENEMKTVTKIMAMLGIVTLPATIGDDVFALTPVLGVLALGNDALAVFGIIAIVRIVMIKRRGGL
jgi:hypothetical protein